MVRSETFIGRPTMNVPTLMTATIAQREWASQNGTGTPAGHVDLPVRCAVVQLPRAWSFSAGWRGSGAERLRYVPLGLKQASVPGMESFVVRVYRRPETPPDSLVGVVEDVGQGRQIPFHDMKELWAILVEKQAAGKRGTLGKGSPPSLPG